jgi:hypothetical protein
MEALSLETSTPLHFCALPGEASVNAALAAAFRRLRDDPGTRKSHLLEGRYENIYVDMARLPEAGPVLAAARSCAATLLGRPPETLALGCWFNEMGPGQVTLSHRHDIHDELLSGVYYLEVPDASGDLVVIDEHSRTVVTPRPGLFVFFAPTALHEVTRNESAGVRLSLAMNFGPAAGPEED